MRYSDGLEWEDIVFPRPNPLGLAYTRCPACSADRKRHRNTRTLAVKFDARGSPLFAKCFHCGAYGMPPREDRAERELMKRGIRMFEMKPKNYRKPLVRQASYYSDRMCQYLLSRGIDVSTAMALKVSEGEEYMPQIGRKANTIQFLYVLDGEVVNVKYRDGAKNFKMERDAMLCLYNLDSVKGKSKLIITEGEFDALAMAQAGLGGEYGIVSVPNGATVSQDERKAYDSTGRIPEGPALNLGYLDSSWGHLTDCTEIYISTDHDAAGTRLAMELQRRFFDRAVYRVSFDGFKDANELLVARGEQALRDCVRTAERIRIDDVYSSMDVYEEMEDIYRRGMDMGLPMGGGELGRHLRLMPNYLYIINGVPGHGKSSFVYYMIAYAMVAYNWRFAIVTPEVGRSKFFITLIEILVGKSSRKEHADRMSMTEFRQAAEYVNERVMLVSSQEMLTPDQVNDRFKMLIGSYGINACVVDPWNSLLHERHDRDDEYLMEQLSRIRLMCLHHNIAYFISAHPVTMREKEKGKSDRVMVPTAYHLAGGAMWYNRADTILTVYRDPNDGDNITEIHVQKVKQHDVGGLPTPPDSPVRLAYSIATKRYRDAYHVDHMPDFPRPSGQTIELAWSERKPEDPDITMLGDSDLPF